MAPRVVAAPHVTANTELAERIRQQREAAERMAEQRIAEAKERAVPSPPAAGAQSPKPRFSFAEEELKQARQQPPATAPTTAPAGRWNQMPQQRPMFTAERYAPGSSADPRLGALPPGQRPGMRAGAM
ncbi:MAG: hypothetical protein M3N38_00290, partial [Pseudomonadota bacterium]|nr:hypothetical protein [Pseudomonadota bacterium]